MHQLTKLSSQACEVFDTGTGVPNSLVVINRETQLVEVLHTERGILTVDSDNLIRGWSDLKCTFSNKIPLR